MNESLMQFWAGIHTQFDALNKRERWLVVGAVLFVTYFLLNMMMLNPVLTKKKLLITQISTDQMQLQMLQQKIALMNAQAVADPDAPNQQRIEALQSRLNTLDSQLGEMRATLITPAQIPALLRSMLKKNGKLKLVSLKTLPVESLIKPDLASNTLTSNNVTNNSVANSRTPSEGASEVKNAGTANTVAGLSPEQATNIAGFKHGVEIHLEGRYLDLLAYVSALEKTPWHLLWSKAELDTEHSPLSQLKLTVYTLSVNQTWLSI